MISITEISVEIGNPVLGINRMLSLACRENFFETTAGIQGKMERALVRREQDLPPVRRLAVRRSLLLPAERETEEITAQHREKRRQLGIFRGLPGCERIGRDIAPRQMENDRCEMSAACGDGEVELWSRQVKRRFAVSRMHGGIRL